MNRTRTSSLDAFGLRDQRNRIYPTLEAGDGSTLSLDFTAMNVLDSRLTLTRASTVSTFINASGLIATAGTDVPRFDYNPITVASRGLLIEGSATNLLQRSNAFNTSPWATNGYTHSTGSTSPHSTESSQRLTVTGSGTLGVLQTFTVTSTSLTFSVWWKNGNWTGSTGSSPRELAIRNNTTATMLLRFRIDNPTTTPTAGYITGTSGVSFQNYGNGWYRIVATVTSGITSGNAIGIYIGGLLGSFIGSGESSDWYGAQVEAGAQASSYIPTGSSTVQRATDQMTMANIAALNFNQSGGTVFMEMEGNPKDVNTFPHFAAFEQSSSGRGWAFLRLNNSTTSGLRMLGTAFTGAGSTIISSTSHTRPSGKFKFATTLEPSICRITYVIAGGSALVDTATAGTLATIGSLKFNNTIDTGASDFASVWISQFKYWPSVLPNATLQSITA